MPKILHVYEVSEDFETANLTKTNTESKKLRLYLPPEATAHLGAKAGDLAAFRTGKLNGKPCLILTRAEIVA